MDLLKSTICLLFRKPDRFFSIEKVFQQLEPELSKKISVEQWTAPNGYASPKSIIENLKAVKKCNGDVYHVTGDIHYIVLALPRNRTLLTIHDCIFLYRSAGFKRMLLKWLFLKIPVSRCRMITTISEATKQDIIRNTGCPPDKIIVIPDPVDNTIQFSAAEFKKQEPVILFIGSTKHKNLDRVIPALENLPCHLRIIGNLSDYTIDNLKKYNINFSQQSKLSDEAMAQEYYRCDIVLFPSTFEGFGLPIVEGQKAGRPVVTSNISPMKDVAGAAACLVDPFDVHSIREGILKVVNDDNYRQQLIEAGCQNVNRFAPSEVAKQYLACYEKLLSL
ncbi:MAG: glycosyltransferase family 4 protein [Bacteroidetes bacterium]|nr:glycosyltransferase family 4 protein [Bacteroidota bacterium]